MDVTPVMSGSFLCPGLSLVELNSTTGYLKKKVRFISIVHSLKQYKTTDYFSFQTATNKDMILGASEWLVANINMKGFYRVNYDSQNWERLLSKLSSQHQVQHLQCLSMTSHASRLN